jgi:hypothetical protein
MTVAPDQPLVLRCLPVPDCEPPYDDEIGRDAPEAAPPTAMDAVQGTLALSFTLPSGVPAVPEAPAQLRLVPPLPDRGRTREADRPSTPARREDDVADGGRGRPSADSDNGGGSSGSIDAAGLPDPRIWTGRLVQAVVEVLNGERPLPQLVRWTSSDVYASLSARLRSSTTRVAPTRSARAGAAPSSPAHSRSTDADEKSRAVVRSLRICQPSSAVVEATAVLKRGARTRAVALRLEGYDGRWRCTALEMC